MKHVDAGGTRPGKLEPMYATVGQSTPAGDEWAFEPKYDGIRVLAFATPAGAALVTRNGKDKGAQFPEIVDALRALTRRSRRELVLDGEIVALRDGVPARFQQLQARMHVQDRSAITRHAREAPAGFVVFDILVDGDDVLLDDPWTQRRAMLERRLRRAPRPLMLGESERDAEALLKRARREGWEGIIAKRVDAAYRPGDRSRAWLKLKLEHRQEFVVGGWTEPRLSRPHLGALLLGYYDDGRLVYAGHMGGGFTHQGLEEMYDRLRRLEVRASPFEHPPKTNEPAHWVRPEVVVEVRFNEWTDEGKLRQPIFLGARDDKEAREVTREARSVQPIARRSRSAAVRTGAARKSSTRTAAARARTTAARKTSSRKTAARTSSRKTSARKSPARKSSGPETASRKRSPRSSGASRTATRTAPPEIVKQLAQIERGGGDGELRFQDGRTLRVTSLGKTFFPEPGFTKGDLMRYYARVAPLLLPLIADRPLALRRFPNGVKGPSFYQQNAGDSLPDGVRTAEITDVKGEREPRFIGGDLVTLLYTVQLGSIDVHAWHSRLGSLDTPDHSLLDLDPGEGVAFGQIVRVAKAIERVLDEHGLAGALKTSGSRGLHIAIPLAGGLSFQESSAVAEAVARRAAELEPSITTLERRIKARPRGTVYLDYQQNARGKTIASAYAVRARAGATVSMPVAWRSLRRTLDPAKFTIATAPRRAAAGASAWSEILDTGNGARTLRALIR